MPSQLRQNLIANFAGKSWAAIISLLFIPVYIKFMGIEAYGLVGVYYTLLALLYMLDMGLSPTLNRELAIASVKEFKSNASRDLTRTLEVVYWLIAILAGSIVALSASFITDYWLQENTLSTDTIRVSIILIGLAIIFHWPFTLYSSGLIGLQRQVLLNGIIASMATVRAIGAVLVLWVLSPTPQAFFLWHILISIIQTIVTGICLWRALPKSHVNAKFRIEALLDVWRFAAGLAGISALAAALTQVDKLVLSKVLSLEMFGYYSLAWIAASGLYYLIGPFFHTLFPRFSQLVALNDTRALTNLYHRSCQFLSVVVLPMTVFMAFFSYEILIIWTQDIEVTQNTYFLLSLLVIGTAANGLMNLPYAVQLAYGWTKLALYSNLIATILLIPLVYFMAINYGGTGAAIVWIILNSGYILISLQIMHRKYLKGELLRWYKEDFIIPLSGAVIVSLIGKLLVYRIETYLSISLALIGILILSYFVAGIMTAASREWILIEFDKIKSRLISGNI